MKRHSTDPAFDCKTRRFYRGRPKNLPTDHRRCPVRDDEFLDSADCSPPFWFAFSIKSFKLTVQNHESSNQKFKHVELLVLVFVSTPCRSSDGNSSGDQNPVIISRFHQNPRQGRRENLYTAVLRGSFIVIVSNFVIRNCLPSILLLTSSLVAVTSRTP